MALPSTEEILISAFQKLGVVETGASALAPEETTVGLAEFNALIGQWNVQRRLGAYRRRESFTFTTARPSYTIGNTADSPHFAVASGGRPTAIEAANVIDTSSTPNSRYPCGIMTDAQFQSLSQPELTSTFPTSIYYAPEYPNGRIFPYPAYPSNTTWKLELFWWDQLNRVDLANIASALSLAPGAERALVLTLAEALWLSYPGRDLAVIERQARKARADYQAWNTRPPNVNADPLGVSAPSGFNHISRLPG